MLNNGDFIKVQYTGYDDKGNVFDSTSGEIAKTLHGKEGSLLIVIGKHRLIKGLEDAVRSMKKDEEKEVNCSPDVAFGPKSKDLIKIMNQTDFIKNNIMPQPGLTVHVDTDQGRLYGLIKSTNSGRILVDFNHPLAGKPVRYKIKITDVLEKAEDRLKAIVDEVGVNATPELKDDEVTFTVSKKEESLEEKKAMLLTLVKGLIPSIKKMNFKETD